MRSNVYDDVTDFQVCGFTKKTKGKYLEKETLLSVQISKFIHRIFTTALYKKKYFSRDSL